MNGDRFDALVDRSGEHHLWTEATPAATTGLVANFAAFMAAGVAMVVWNVITVSLRQRITPDHLLGRMNSAYRLVGWGTMPGRRCPRRSHR